MRLSGNLKMISKLILCLSACSSLSSSSSSTSLLRANVADIDGSFRQFSTNNFLSNHLCDAMRSIQKQSQTLEFNKIIFKLMENAISWKGIRMFVAMDAPHICRTQDADAHLIKNRQRFYHAPRAWAKLFDGPHGFVSHARSLTRHSLEMDVLTSEQTPTVVNRFRSINRPD